MSVQDLYPSWIYYPAQDRPPGWATDFVEVVRGTAERIDSRVSGGLDSNAVLRVLRPGLESLGYQVESSKRHADRIRRPVLFGENGVERVAYEIDAVHDSLGVLVEIEAGRGADGNAVYRDLVRASLIVDARFFVLCVLQQYRRMSGGRQIIVQSYRDARNQLDAIYASGRLGLPFEGVLLVGY
ncbi:MAG: hypothetical protein AB7Q27_24580 [Acidimicrobiia bacterium]